MALAKYSSGNGLYFSGTLLRCDACDLHTIPPGMWFLSDSAELLEMPSGSSVADPIDFSSDKGLDPFSWVFVFDTSSSKEVTTTNIRVGSKRLDQTVKFFISNVIAMCAMRHGAEHSHMISIEITGLLGDSRGLWDVPDVRDWLSSLWIGNPELACYVDEETLTILILSVCRSQSIEDLVSCFGLSDFEFSDVAEQNDASKTLAFAFVSESRARHLADELFTGERLASLQHRIDGFTSRVVSVVQSFEVLDMSSADNRQRQARASESLDVRTGNERHYQEGDVIGDRFLVQEVLYGGSGEVYLCMDLRGRGPIALKTVRTDLRQSKEHRNVIAREVRIWRHLGKHPNIVQCHGSATFDRCIFILMEWVVGEVELGADLRQWLDRSTRLRDEDALSIITDVCQALVHIQDVSPGLVHLDLKPENILVANGPLAKVTDFGSARILKSHDRSDGRGLSARRRGTPEYMAPEQWLDEALDVRTDIYALGGIFFELVSGRRAFDGETIDDLRDQHLSVLPSCEHLPDSFSELIATCLKKAPESRFPDAGALLSALKRIRREI